MPRPGLFFSRLKLFLGHPLLLGVAAHITRGRAVWPDGMALTKVPHGRALHDDPCGLLHIGRQLFVGPVRAIEPTPRRASFHPHLNRRPQRLGKPSRLAWCPLNLQALYAPFVMGVTGRARKSHAASGNSITSSVSLGSTSARYGYNRWVSCSMRYRMKSSQSPLR